MRDFEKDIKDIRQLVIHEYNKKRNIILKNVKFKKKTKPAWKGEYRFYGTQTQNVDEYFGVDEQLSPEILNKLEIVNKIISNLAVEEFVKYFDKHFHNFISIKNIKIESRYDYKWYGSPPADKKVLCFYIDNKRMTEFEFAEYLKEKYYYR